MSNGEPRSAVEGKIKENFTESRTHEWQMAWDMPCMWCRNILNVQRMHRTRVLRMSVWLLRRSAHLHRQEIEKIERCWMAMEDGNVPWLHCTVLLWKMKAPPWLLRTSVLNNFMACCQCRVRRAPVHVIVLSASVCVWSVDSDNNSINNSVEAMIGSQDWGTTRYGEESNFTNRYQLAMCVETTVYWEAFKQDGLWLTFTKDAIPCGGFYVGTLSWKNLSRTSAHPYTEPSTMDTATSNVVSTSDWSLRRFGITSIPH